MTGLSYTTFLLSLQVGLTPIHLASENGQTQIVEMLTTQHGGNVDNVSLVRSRVNSQHALRVCQSFVTPL